MCRQSSEKPTSSTQKSSPSPSPHLYLTVLSLSTVNPEKPKLLQNHTWPTPSEITQETKSIAKLSAPMVLTGLLLYSRAMVSMLFLGHLGELELAAGALSIAFANITGYSVISGLAMGMEPICSQAFGAQQWNLLSLTLQKTVLFLLSSSLPIAALWLNMSKILLWFNQDAKITQTAQIFLLFSLPDLISHSFLHPIRIFLRAQGITTPLTISTGIAAVLHVPVNFFLVTHLNLGVSGVALAAAASNFNLLLFLLCYLRFIYKGNLSFPTKDCLKNWQPLLKLAIPTCISVCLEWWWYEFMIMLCGFFVNPRATVASMGVLIQTTSLVYIFPSALSLGVSIRVGNELGANRPEKARTAMVVAMGLAAMLSLAAMGFATATRDTWGKMFTTDPEILKLTSAALPILGLCEFGNCPQTAGCGVLRGSARPNQGANINLGSFYFVGMPIAVVLGFLMDVGFNGLWLGLLAAQMCCAGLMLYALGTTDWNAEAERAQILTSTTSVDRAQLLNYTTSGSRNDSPAGGDSLCKLETEPLISINLSQV